MIRFFRNLIRWLFRLWVEHLVCIHFCKFREAGSDFGYTHVHVLPKNPRGATGVGHDDHTTNDDPGHVTISDGGGGCRVQAEDEASMALRNVGYLATAHFHSARAGECPPGFRRIRCRCRDAEGQDVEVDVCYTLDQDAFERWRLENSYAHRIGQFEISMTTASKVLAQGLPPVVCGSTIVVYQAVGSFVADCSGFGAGDSDNSLVQKARAKVREAVDRVQCEPGCQKSHEEIFVGWTCAWKSYLDSWWVDAIVQWRVRCA
jgi:hypothetical protein